MVKQTFWVLSSDEGEMVYGTLYEVGEKLGTKVNLASLDNACSKKYKYLRKWNVKRYDTETVWRVFEKDRLVFEGSMIDAMDIVHTSSRNMHYYANKDKEIYGYRLEKEVRSTLPDEEYDRIVNAGKVDEREENYRMLKRLIRTYGNTSTLHDIKYVMKRFEDDGINVLCTEYPYMEEARNGFRRRTSYLLELKE